VKTLIDAPDSISNPQGIGLYLFGTSDACEPSIFRRDAISGARDIFPCLEVVKVVLIEMPGEKKPQGEGDNCRLRPAAKSKPETG